MEFQIETVNGERFELYPHACAIPEGSITENAACSFHCTGQDIDVFDLSLKVDGAELDRIGVSQHHASWRWNTGFHAGVAEVELRGTPNGTIVRDVETDPRRAKLTRSQYTRMLQDIFEDSFALLSISGHRVEFLRGNVRPPEIARFEYIRYRLEEIEKHVIAINQSPALLLERRSRQVPLSQCISATPQELADSTRYARRITDDEFNRLSESGRRLSEAMNQCLPTHVPVSRTQQHRRRQEHSAILGALQGWKSFMQLVSIRLNAFDADELDSTNISILRQRCSSLVRRIDRLISLELFEGVTPSKGAIQQTQLFRRAPHYRDFYRLYQESLLGLGAISGDFLRLPLRRTFDLYELWCFLRLIRAASMERNDDTDYSQAFDEHPDQTGLILTLDTRPFRFLDFTLLFKPRYREIWKRETWEDEGPIAGSFSRPMEPDIAFERSRPDGEFHRPILILDAKYRVETQLNDAVTTLHTYRDALVEADADRENVSRSIQAALILSPHIPGVAMQAEDWRDDSPPDVFFRNEYTDEFKFGVIVLRPGISVEDCRTVLRRIVEFVGE